MAVGALVLLFEAPFRLAQHFFVDAGRVDSDRDLRGLPRVAEIERSRTRDVGCVEPLLAGAGHEVVPHLVDDPLHRRRLHRAGTGEHGPNGVVLDLGAKEAERAEQPRRRRHHDRADPERVGHPAGVKRTRAAKGHEDEAGRVSSPFDRNRLDGTHHVRVGDEVHPVCGIGDRET